ncbi:MAG: prepilin peptidase [Terrimicrobiaceae bacterium]|nr:prepilin peptidase [Terrimicrobiaceae bacterium]
MTTVLAVASAVLGAVVGSFLNACIHRMPRGISLANPRRSFCPSCQKMIPWYENLPVVSWLVLRGKCSTCGAPISPRYVLVEILTAAVFFAIWDRFGLPLAPVYWVFVALLIVATFIDFEHFIIPDEITIGGTVAGILLSVVVPAAMGAESPLWSGLFSLAGAALGFGVLWLVVEGGKLAFGRKKHVFPEGEAFAWVRDGDRADVRIGEDKLAWEEVFSRESDVLVLETIEPSRAGERELPAGPLRFFYNRVVAGDIEIDLDSLDQIEGRLRSVVIPREAMGFGDVKFMACIGAFLGWQAILFTLLASSVIGCLAAVAGLFLARDRSGARLPFGPFLAVAAILWLFGGRELTEWYLAQFRGFGINADF